MLSQGENRCRAVAHSSNIGDELHFYNEIRKACTAMKVPISRLMPTSGLA